MRLIPLVCLAFVLLVSSPPPVTSAPFDGQPKLLLHVRAPIVQSPCANHGALGDCAEAVTSGGFTTPSEGPYFFVYLLAARGSLAGVAGIHCGITYQGGASGALGDLVGIDILAWRLCATMDTKTPGAPVWPQPGGGNTIIWDLPENCRDGEVAVAGYFYLGAYSSDVLQLTADPVSGTATLRNCLSNTAFLDVTKDLGSARFSPGAAEAGCNPCDLACDGIPVVPVTWGAIKLLFD